MFGELNIYVGSKLCVDGRLLFRYVIFDFYEKFFLIIDKVWFLKSYVVVCGVVICCVIFGFGLN